MHPDFRAWYDASPEFRELLANDFLLNRCVYSGQSPVQTVNNLCKHLDHLRNQMVKIHQFGLPPIIIFDPKAIEQSKVGK